MKFWKKLTIGLVILVVAIQFIPTNRNVPAVVPANDFIQIERGIDFLNIK